MLTSLHKRETMAPKFRASIAVTDEPAWMVAERNGISEQTVLKWHKRSDVQDWSRRRNRLQATLFPAQDSAQDSGVTYRSSRSVVAVALWKVLSRLLDDLLAVVREFLNPLASHDEDRAALMTITKPLTDNAKALTDRLFGLRKRAATRQHEFDLLCAELGLAPPMRPQSEPWSTLGAGTMASGKVERFNGRNEDALQSHRFQSGEHQDQAILCGLRLSNSQLPLSVPKGRSPIDALKNRLRQRPGFFTKRDYRCAGCDRQRVYGIWNE